MNMIGIDKIFEKLNQAHPMQIVNLTEKDVRFMFFEVRYEYLTMRKNKREGVKYFIIDTYNPNFNIEPTFIDWIKKYNKDNKHRQISNVKILESLCLGYINI